MYRIVFDPRCGRFLVQISAWFGLFWKNVMCLDASGDDLIPMAFKTFDEAKEYIASIGLDQLYANKSEDQYRTYLKAA